MAEPLPTSANLKGCIDLRMPWFSCYKCQSLTFLSDNKSFWKIVSPWHSSVIFIAFLGTMISQINIIVYDLSTHITLNPHSLDWLDTYQRIKSWRVVLMPQRQIISNKSVATILTWSEYLREYYWNISNEYNHNKNGLPWRGSEVWTGVCQSYNALRVCYVTSQVLNLLG